tara:strand:- start:220 stop:978 length:759 start_codon:yes stop_codon:yes gene_type:complete
MATPRKKAASKHKATQTKAERLDYLARLYREGNTIRSIYKIMISKYNITPRTVRVYMSELGKEFAQYIEDEESVDLEMSAIIDRLRDRAVNAQGSVANRADELLLNLMGVRQLKPYKKSLDDQKLRIETARAQLAEAQAQIATIEAAKAIKAADRESRWGDQFLDMLGRIKENRSASVKDVLHLTCLFLEHEIAKGPDANMRQVLSTLRHLTKISMVDPSGMGAEHQLFTLPDGMSLEIAPEADEGDNLIDE